MLQRDLRGTAETMRRLADAGQHIQRWVLQCYSGYVAEECKYYQWRRNRTIVYYDLFAGIFLHPVLCHKVIVKDDKLLDN